MEKSDSSSKMYIELMSTPLSAGEKIASEINSASKDGYGDEQTRDSTNSREAKDGSQSERITTNRQPSIQPKSKTKVLRRLDHNNFILHQSFIRSDYNACKAQIKEMIDEYNGITEYPFYIRGKIDRIEGNLRGALEWFGKAQQLNPANYVYIREIGRIHFLLGNHTMAANTFQQAIEMNQSDWKLYYWRSMALYYNKKSVESAQQAQECLLSAPQAEKCFDLLILLAKLCERRNDMESAINAYQKALEIEPDNLDALANMGRLHVRMQNDDQAFVAFGKALSTDPTHPQSILAAGFIIQLSGEFDVSLTKYRVAVEKCEYNGPLWNNIGMCFYGKSKYVAAVSCLKKANYLCPLEWKICFNLGLVHNAMQQYASAYHFLSSAINLNSRSAIAYMGLAVVLTNLDDTPNASKAYDRAMQLDKGKTPLIQLNAAIFEAKRNECGKSADYLNAFLAASGKRTLSISVSNAVESLKNVLARSPQLNPSSK